MAALIPQYSPWKSSPARVWAMASRGRSPAGVSTRQLHRPSAQAASRNIPWLWRVVRTHSNILWGRGRASKAQRRMHSCPGVRHSCPWAKGL